MKKFVLILSCVLLTATVGFAKALDPFSTIPVRVADSKKLKKAPISKQFTEEMSVHTEMSIEEDALNCKITVTVSIGIISVSGTVSGPCDEVQAQAVQLIGNLIEQAKELAANL